MISDGLISAQFSWISVFSGRSSFDFLTNPVYKGMLF